MKIKIIYKYLNVIWIDVRFLYLCLHAFHGTLNYHIYIMLINNLSLIFDVMSTQYQRQIQFRCLMTHNEQEF